MASNSLPNRSGNPPDPPLGRADDVSELVDAIKELIVPFIRAADEDAAALQTGHGLVVKGGGPRTALVEYHPPHKLGPLLDLNFSDEGKGKEGLLEIIQKILQFSVNTWTQGFMDKLYSSTDAVRGNYAPSILKSILFSCLSLPSIISAQPTPIPTSAPLS